jgi:hypothetical protein
MVPVIAQWHCSCKGPLRPAMDLRLTPRFECQPKWLSIENKDDSVFMCLVLAIEIIAFSL